MNNYISYSLMISILIPELNIFNTTPNYNLKLILEKKTIIKRKYKLLLETKVVKYSIEILGTQQTIHELF